MGAILGGRLCDKLGRRRILIVCAVISEIYPLSVRGLAMSAVTAVIWATYLIVTLTFLSLIEALGRPDTCWLYAALCVVSFVYVYFYMPETNGLSLEQIEEHWLTGKGGTKI